MNTTTMTDPVAQWESEVAALMQGGATKAAATRQLATSNPTLHQAYLAEFNSRHQKARVERSNSAPPSHLADDRRPTSAPAVDDSADASGDGIQAWDAAVAAEMRKGHSRADANRNVAINQPDLQKRYLAAYKAAADAGLRPGARHRQQK